MEGKGGRGRERERVERIEGKERGRETCSMGSWGIEPPPPV